MGYRASTQQGDAVVELVAGSVAVVTGAAQGIGAEICAQFLRAGADVWGSDLDAAALARSAEVIAGCLGEEGAPGSFQARVVDVTDSDAVEGWVAGARAGGPPASCG